MHSSLTRYSTGLVAIAMLAMLAVMSDAAYAAGKITICHVPPGNPGNAHTMTISENAWAAHQAHGDSQGSCPQPPPGNGGGTGGGGESLDDGFAVLLCDGRQDNHGRRIAVSNVGRVMVQEAEC